METKFIFTVIIFCILSFSVRAQEMQSRFIFFEAGIDGIGCDAPDKDYIRAVSSPYSYYNADRIKSAMMLGYFGIKCEYRVFDDLFGIAGGLRYTHMITSIGRNSYASGSPDFFYVIYNQEGMDTEYAKVREITQNADYLGVPLEIRIYPRKERRINYYFKTGISFNLKISSRSDIVFSNDFMEQYQNEIFRLVEKAGQYYTGFIFGMGLRIGKSEKPGFFIEATAPAGVFYPGKSNFVDPLAGGGFQLMARIPFKSNKTGNEKKSD